MSSPFFAGVDVGGTNIKVGLVDVNGEVLVSEKFPTLADESPSTNLRNVASFVERLIIDEELQMEDLVAVGLATPGPMDLEAGMILTPFNLPGWRHQNVRDMLANFCRRRVAFANDANAAAFGEYWVGSGREYSSAILMTLGTGVGGGIIVNQRAIDGAHSHGAEIGHMIVDNGPKARKCSCGNFGHLEAYASANGLVSITADRIASGQISSLTKPSDDASPLSALMIFEAAQAGDKLANDVINETAVWLGIAVTSLAHIVDPQVFLLGGAMNFGKEESSIGRNFLSRICATVKQRALPVIGEKLAIKFATLGSNAGFIGAAGLAKRQFYDNAIPA